MKHPSRILSAFLLLPALLALGACQTKQALDTRMEEIAGEYRLQSISDNLGHYLSRMDDAERAAVSSARVVKVHPGAWIFEYTLPIRSGMDTFRYHHLVQEITWDQSFGCYFFSRLSEEDLDPTGFEPDHITVEVLSHGTIVFHNLRNGTVCEWVKIQGAS